MARKNSGNMGEFTFKMRLSSEQIEQLWELTKQDPTRRSIIAMMNDGSYRVLGEIVKLPDCPQDEFDKALERLSELANGYEKEQPQPVRGSIAPEVDLGARMLAHFRRKTKPTWCNIPVKDIIDYLEGVSATKEIDFEEAVYKAFGQVKDFTLAIRIARYFYNLNPKHK